MNSNETERELGRATRLLRLERGRDLTDAEIAEFLADRQTSIRHGTADVAVEIAAQLYDRLRRAVARSC